jgi:hypothetical protein
MDNFNFCLLFSFYFEDVMRFFIKGTFYTVKLALKKGQKYYIMHMNSWRCNKNSTWENGPIT